MTFAERFYEQLVPFANLDASGDAELLAEATGAMFQEVEDLASDRQVFVEQGEGWGHWETRSGYSILLDVDSIRIEKLPFLAQFVGAIVPRDFSDADKRSWVKAAVAFSQGRPKGIVDAVQATLTGSKYAHLRERDGSAWRFTVFTKTSETPNPALTNAVLQAWKPGPDIATLVVSDTISYGWLTENEATYGALDSDFASYDDLRTREV